MRLDLLAALAGILISIQSRANGELAQQLNNGLEASIVSFGSGLIVLLAVTIFMPGVKQGLQKLLVAVREGKLPSYRIFAGTLGALFVAVQTMYVPLMGVAIFSVAAIAGQAAASLGVDRIGLTGGGKKHITKRRVIAALLTIFAVLISVLDRIDAHNLPILGVFLAVLVGVIVGIQRAYNGQINEYSGNSFTTALLNFVTGVCFLIIVFLIGLVTHFAHYTPLPLNPMWMYMGGSLGVFYIAFSSTIVQHLGVLTFTLFTVGGQLVGSLLLDLLLPTKGANVSWYLVTGIVMTYLGVVAGGVGQTSLARKKFQVAETIDPPIKKIAKP